jgi:diadenosine tetraphosphatase ApaH/serine/threonine PP2A family protein phosphatase
VFTTSPEFISPGVPPGETEVAIDLPAGKAMVNVGSVGQPRDEDPRSCYVVLEDDRRVRFRRIAYPLETTRKKIHSIPDLDNFLGDRLTQGR